MLPEQAHRDRGDGGDATSSLLSLPLPRRFPGTIGARALGP
jgi:hypothetical protein